MNEFDKTVNNILNETSCDVPLVKFKVEPLLNNAREIYYVEIEQSILKHQITISPPRLDILDTYYDYIVSPKFNGYMDAREYLIKYYKRYFIDNTRKTSTNGLKDVPIINSGAFEQFKHQCVRELRPLSDLLGKWKVGRTHTALEPGFYYHKVYFAVEVDATMYTGMRNAIDDDISNF